MVPGTGFTTNYCQKHIGKEFSSMRCFHLNHNICNDTKGNNIPSDLNSLNDNDPEQRENIRRQSTERIQQYLWFCGLPYHHCYIVHRSNSNTTLPSFSIAFFQSQSIGTRKHTCLHVPPKNQPNTSKTIVNATNPQVSNPTSPVLLFPMHTLTSAISLLDKVSNAFNASFKAGLGVRLYGIGWHQRMVSCEEGIIREENDIDDDDDDHHPHQILEGCWKSWQLEVRDIVPTSY